MLSDSPKKTMDFFSKRKGGKNRRAKIISLEEGKVTLHFSELSELSKNLYLMQEEKKRPHPFSKSCGLCK